MSHKRVAIGLAAVIPLLLTTYGHSDAPTDFRLVVDAFDAAGGTVSSGEYELFFTLSEPVAGGSTDSEYRLWSGMVTYRRQIADAPYYQMLIHLDTTPDQRGECFPCRPELVEARALIIQ